MNRLSNARLFGASRSCLQGDRGPPEREKPLLLGVLTGQPTQVTPTCQKLSTIFGAEFLTTRRRPALTSGQDRLAPSTIRGYHLALRMFCERPAAELDYRLCCTTRTMRISRTPPSTWAVPSATKPYLR